MSYNDINHFTSTQGQQYTAVLFFFLKQWYNIGTQCASLGISKKKRISLAAGMTNMSKWDSMGHKHGDFALTWSSLQQTAHTHITHTSTLTQSLDSDLESAFKLRPELCLVQNCWHMRSLFVHTQRQDQQTHVQMDVQNKLCSLCFWKMSDLFRWRHEWQRGGVLWSL